MKRFTLQFGMDNAAFHEYEDSALAEIARILVELAVRIEDCAAGSDWSIFDSNGNNIGRAWVR